MKLNKALLTLGTLAAVAAPIATVVSCGDKTPAKEQPPVTPINTGPQKPVPQTPGTNGAVTQPQDDVLKDGIFNYATKKTFTNKDLNDIFGKFTTSINISGGSSSYGSIGNLNKMELDRTKQMVKILMVADVNDNNGGVYYFPGIIGHQKGADAIICLFTDMEKVEFIKDNPTEGSKKVYSIYHPDAIEAPNLFMLWKNVSATKVMADIKAFADKVITK